MEPRLKLTEEAVAATLPVLAQTRGVRGRPNLSRTPDAASLQRARALLAFLAGVRSVAAEGGFAATRGGVAQRLEARLHQYVEDLLEVLHQDGGAEPAEKARALLDIAAHLLERLVDGRAAKVARRRAAA